MTDKKRTESGSVKKALSQLSKQVTKGELL